MNSNVPKNKHTENKKRTVTTIAIIGIVLSLLSGVGYYAYYRNVQNQAEATRQAQEATKKTQTEEARRERDAQEEAEFKREFKLNACLQRANTVDVQGVTQQLIAKGASLDEINQVIEELTATNALQGTEDECRSRYPAS